MSKTYILWRYQRVWSSSLSSQKGVLLKYLGAGLFSPSEIWYKKWATAFWRVMFRATIFWIETVGAMIVLVVPPPPPKKKNVTCINIELPKCKTANFYNRKSEIWKLMKLCWRLVDQCIGHFESERFFRCNVFQDKYYCSFFGVLYYVSPLDIGTWNNGSKKPWSTFRVSDTVTGSCFISNLSNELLTDICCLSSKSVNHVSD